jgi:SnoaL-like domain
MVQKMVGPVRSLVIANPAGRSDWKECTVVTGMRQGCDHVDLSVPEAADRLAIRELVDAYAYCADRRDVAGQIALFTEDTELVVFADSRNPEPTQRFRGRTALAPVFHELDSCRATMHFNGQSTTWVDGARASGVTCCLVHELAVDETAHTLMIAALRYLDSFVKKDGKWFIRQRQVLVDWTETRPLATG